MINYKQAIRIVASQLQDDKKDKTENTVYHGFKANIAMEFVDAHANWKRKHGKTPNNKELHEIANKAAINFLDLLMDDSNFYGSK